jgi:hypothetical protein
MPIVFSLGLTSQNEELIVQKNANLTKGNGDIGGVLDGPEKDINEIQRQLESLRARLCDTRAASAGELDTHDRIGLVRNIRHARAIRRNLFVGNLFSDPGWEILLDVYLSELEQRRISISKIGVSSIPASTTLRWLTKLEEVGLVRKEADRIDARRAFVSLTDTGLQMMDAYLDQCWPLLSSWPGSSAGRA